MNLNTGSNSALVRRWLILAMLLALALLIVIGNLWQGRHRRHLKLTLQVSKPSVAQLFYATNGGFSENQSIRKKLHLGSNTLDFRLPYARLTAIRLDPSVNDSPTLIRNVVVSTASGKTMAVQLSSFSEGANVSIHTSAGGLRVVPSAGTHDPQILLSVPKELGQAQWLAGFWSLILGGSMGLLFVLGCIVLALQCRTRTSWLVPGWHIVGGLVMWLALFAPVTRSVSPDEYSHRQAYVYYLHHATPPPWMIPQWYLLFGMGIFVFDGVGRCLLGRGNGHWTFCRT